MINKRSVTFILGAGASASYGFPIGGQLTSQILRALEPGAWLREALVTQDGNQGMRVDQFGQALKYSAQYSVDAFLEHRPEFMHIGKLAIARYLIMNESVHALYPGSGDDWMRYLFSQLSGPRHDYASNKVTFITFNYDRSLETFLFFALKNLYGLKDEQAAELVAVTPIIHLHGSLGALPWQHGDRFKRAFENDVNSGQVKAAAESIKIIHEDIDSERDKDFGAAQRAMTSSDRVYALGFGWARRNMERLGLLDPDCPTILGTCVGMSSIEIASAQDATRGKLRLIGAPGCLAFLRDNAHY